MKPYSVILTLSLAVNALLLGCLVAGRPESTSSAIASGVEATTGGTRKGPAPANGSLWHDLDDPDLKAMAGRLRDSGFPPSIVRAMIAAQISEGFSARRKAIEASAPPRKFYQVAMNDPATTAALRALGREQADVLRQTLGPGTDDEVARGYRRRRFGELPDATLDEIGRIETEYENQRSELSLRARVGNTINYTTEERQKMVDLERQRDADLARAVGPEAWEQHQLRFGSTASSLRYNLTAFHPTEQEFRALFELQRDFDARYSRSLSGPMTAEEARARSDAQRQHTEQIKAALSPERAAEYERATNYDFRQATQLVARLELPPQTVDQVWAVQQDIEKRMQAMQAERGNPAAVQQERLAQFHAEAVARMTAVLGPRGYDAYRENALWLQSLQSRINRPPPARN